ncbi:MAG: hypothetical protein ACEQSR_11385 [Candidatus Methylacidiphilales bacterium]
MKLTYLTMLLLLICSSCSKCPDSNEIRNTYNVNQNDLPYIIPYTDTSIVRFLKNGTDTITFTSQGLQNTYAIESFSEDKCTGNNKVQQVILRMKSSDNEYFETQFGGTKNFKNLGVYVNLNGTLFKECIDVNFIRYYPPVLSYEILNTNYDSLTILTSQYFDTLFFKPKFGFVYFKINNDNYKVIK